MGEGGVSDFFLFPGLLVLLLIVTVMRRLIFKKKNVKIIITIHRLWQYKPVGRLKHNVIRVAHRKYMQWRLSMPKMALKYTDIMRLLRLKKAFII